MSLKPIIAAVCLSLALFLLLFMVWPKYQELQNVNQQIEQTKNQLQKSKEYMARLETLDDRLQEYDTAKKKVESALPSKPKLPCLLNFLQETSNDHGLLLNRISSISQSSSQGDIKKVNINLMMIGSYSSFKNFVRAVENSSRIVEVEEVKFRTPDKEESSPPRFELRLSTHFYAPEQ